MAHLYLARVPSVDPIARGGAVKARIEPRRVSRSLRAAARRSERAEDLARAGRSRHLEHDRSAGRLDGDREAQEAAADALLLDDRGELGEKAGRRIEPQREALLEVMDLGGALDSPRQELVAAVREIARAERAGDGRFVGGGRVGRRRTGTMSSDRAPGCFLR